MFYYSAGFFLSSVNLLSASKQNKINIIRQPTKKCIPFERHVNQHVTTSKKGKYIEKKIKTKSNVAKRHNKYSFNKTNQKIIIYSNSQTQKRLIQY